MPWVQCGCENVIPLLHMTDDGLHLITNCHVLWSCGFPNSNVDNSNILCFHIWICCNLLTYGRVHPFLLDLDLGPSQFSWCRFRWLVLSIVGWISTIIFEFCASTYEYVVIYSHRVGSTPFRQTWILALLGLVGVDLDGWFCPLLVE